MLVITPWCWLVNERKTHFFPIFFYGTFITITYQIVVLWDRCLLNDGNKFFTIYIFIQSRILQQEQNAKVVQNLKVHARIHEKEASREQSVLPYTGAMIQGGTWESRRHKIRFVVCRRVSPRLFFFVSVSVRWHWKIFISGAAIHRDVTTPKSSVSSCFENFYVVLCASNSLYHVLNVRTSADVLTDVIPQFLLSNDVHYTEPQIIATRIIGTLLYIIIK